MIFYDLNIYINWSSQKIDIRQAGHVTYITVIRIQTNKHDQTESMDCVYVVIIENTQSLFYKSCPFL